MIFNWNIGEYHSDITTHIVPSIDQHIQTLQEHQMVPASNFFIDNVIIDLDFIKQVDTNYLH